MNNPNRTKNKLKKIYNCLGVNCDTQKTNGAMIDELEIKAEKGEIGGGGSGVLKTEEIKATEIRTSVESGQAITPPEGYDGFSEITFPSYLFQEKEITVNETMEFGTDSSPYFLKKLTVNVPSDYTVETLNIGKDSDPVTSSYEGKTFVLLGMISGSGTLLGLCGTEGNLLNSNSVSVSSAGTTAGTVSSDPNTKTITYTPNPSFQMGAVRITKVII